MSDLEIFANIERVRMAITCNLTTLCNESQNIDKLIWSLIGRGIISEDHRNEILSGGKENQNQTQPKQFKLMYILLQKKMVNPKTFPAFVKALYESGNDRVVDILEAFENENEIK